ncbi:MAG: hypothetical protein A2583_06765 [Bdellovibrionales bacterium RIFOXYD1_FULL_53_11]|nr:MAG: hypothetical protein A2583_06765 [Bdellovibrionales bacterium RIFOXYD1_FULL_53_11]
MCGIVGYVGSRRAVDVLLQGLRRLEYRGYDSAGIALLTGDAIDVVKSSGKLENVEHLIDGSREKLAASTCGIGHTRWATHGKPTTQNAHPHRTGHVVLVHNGIIENYQDIRRRLVARGHKPESETDSELFGFLVLEEMDKGRSLCDAVRAGFLQIEGSCSVVVMSEKEPGMIVGVRNGSPLVAAHDPDGGMFIASDAQPLVEYTKEVIFLENGDLVAGSRTGLKISSLADGNVIARPVTRIDWSAERMDKQGWPHYMLKEIYEQPAALSETLNGILDRATGEPFVLADQKGLQTLKNATRISLVACGSSWHAALLGKYWLERWGRIAVDVELASEFRYRDPVLQEGTVIVGISQSGETADTLAVMREAKTRGIQTAAITNVRGSTISREADSVFYTCAGPEIGVAATKTFLSQLLVQLIWAGWLGKTRGALNPARTASLFDELIRLPHLLEDYMRPDGVMAQTVRSTAKALLGIKGFFFIGRGYSFPVALEGALKLKEIAYIHAEGYAAGELKHGPIAMIDGNMAVVVLAPQDSWREKTVSNLEEVKARGARIVGVGGGNDSSLKELCDFWIPLPVSTKHKIDEGLLPVVLAPVVQLLSYETALLKGTDVDKPRNLAKSVTVE